MPYAAITYDVKPGYDEEIAELFANFKRADTPVLTDEAGEEVGRLLGTAVFIKDGLLVRVIHYEGDIKDVGRHMSRQRGVHILEEKLKPYLASPRDTATPERFRQHFANSLMRCIAQLSVPAPAAAG
ncbi:SchA/CurD-like domain-containing protein [Streptomyces morookaense]|uniref:SchA/CurD n=1 Tax=Streptomyces morookaense TaxID=1970 RepID=A0A7Y7B517_STRMO|nr:SchA/CurD-like domain-containing protein [Streptomyces morookaense]NVK79161.1 SchA/CurD [Streptomyces morookaense]GHF28080.1 SchA/CurD [Streptomyces morookaense]